MKKKLLFGLLLAAFLPLTALSQDFDDTEDIDDGDDTKISATAIASYLNAKNEWHEATVIDDGEAPLEVSFRPVTKNMGSHTPAYEWHFRKMDKDSGREPDFMVRYDEETTYRFVESGTYHIVLKTTLTDTGEALDSSVVTVAISESMLEFPNAFSPNGDDYNETFGAKTDKVKNIVEFHAYIFNRQGQKLYDWTDPRGSWDGTFHGSPVKEGVYYVLVKAKGSDGRVYNIRKDVNLVRGYITTGNSGTVTP